MCAAPPSPHSSWSTLLAALARTPSATEAPPSLPFSAPSRVPWLSDGESSEPRGEPVGHSGCGTGFRRRETSALFSRRPRQTVKGWWSAACCFGGPLRSLLEPISSRSCCKVCCNDLRLRWRIIRNTYCRWLTWRHKCQRRGRVRQAGARSISGKIS